MILHSIGYEIQKYPAHQKNNKRDQHFFNLLQSHDVDLVLDVGAASGGYGTWLRSLGYKKRIVSFEPLRVSFENLKKTIERDAEWVGLNYALADNEGNELINVAGNLDSSSLLPMLAAHERAAPHTKVTRQELIQKKRLDRCEHPWMADFKSGFLKLDVQGYEKQVLEGSKELMNKVVGLQIEMSLVPLYAGQILFEEQIKLCNDMGFQLSYIRPGFADSKTGRLLQCDGIFFRSTN